MFLHFNFAGAEIDYQKKIYLWELALYECNMYLSVSLLRLVESNSVCLKCVSNVLSAHRNVCLRRNNKSERRLTYISASVYEDHVINYKGSRRKHHEEGKAYKLSPQFWLP